MMKRMVLILFCSICLLMLGQNRANALGLFYTNAVYPVTATGAEVKDLSNLKRADVSTTTILFIFEHGDAGIDKAVRDAGITKISYVDVQEKSVFIFWRKLTVRVYGE